MSVRCIICDETDKWQSVDEYRESPKGMEICMNCGFVTYPKIIAKTEDLKQFYREEYRAAPSVQNVYTGQRKLHYHERFLREPVFEKWKKENKTKPVIGEQGAAFGMFLDWVRREFPDADVNGTELTKSFRRVAYHEYGLTLTEEFDTSKKYDLIVSYKVAEHIPYIDEELKKLKNCLNEGGFLYISVPTWFHTMSNFGTDGFTLDYYYHTNHINVWTRKLFETLLAKCGLEVKTIDRVIYGDTYLCTRGAERKTQNYEQAADVIDALDKIKKAADMFGKNKHEEAIKIFPSFPTGHLAAYEQNRPKLHKAGWDTINKVVIKPALKHCPWDNKVVLFAADLAFRYDKLDLALEYLQKFLEMRPMDPNGLKQIAAIYRVKAERNNEQEVKNRLYNDARNLEITLGGSSLQHMPEAVTMRFNDASKIPAPAETV